MNLDSLEKRLKAHVEKGAYFTMRGLIELHWGESHASRLVKKANLEVVHHKLDTNYDSYGVEYSDLEIVFKDLNDSKFWRLYGTSSSYNGTEWDGIEEVFEKSKTIKYYERQ